MTDDKHIMSAWENLIAGILHQAVVDVQKGRDVDDVIAFARSPWCKELCQGIDLQYPAYLNKIEELL